MLSNSNAFGPPDDWLKLSDSERAKAQQLAHDSDLGPQLPTSLAPPAELSEPVPATSEPPIESPPAPALADAVALAESLKPDDRMRLIGHLWQSLPPRNRGAIIAFGLENIPFLPHEPEPTIQNDVPPVESIWPKVWEFLFDPTKTSGLYSAPRRFDLATIFVVTAAYSIVFGVMSSLNYYGAAPYFGPVTQVAVGVLITVVALIQALYYHDANPRGVSIVAGAITQTLIVGFLATMNWYSEPFTIVIVFYGVIGGAISGYLAGAIVGGVFLVADALRGKVKSRSTSESGDRAARDAD